MHFAKLLNVDDDDNEKYLFRVFTVNRYCFYNKTFQNIQTLVVGVGWVGVE